ncbi:MAG TPA: hypothetical protein VGQ52_04750 [Gemmatimonadaceae bacterium]|nr:hypothetical protein [Gemmatimonadaceae bacterium]
MARYFPRHTQEWKHEESPAFQRLTRSLVEMALLTGVALRLFHAIAHARAGSAGWIYLGSIFAIGMIILLGAATLHLGNYTLRNWAWRAPAFGAIEALAECLTIAALIAIGREPLGTGRANWGDWPGLAFDAIFYRTIVVSVYALILGGAVKLVRSFLTRTGTPITDDTPASSEIV